jgi:hypothetical protein
MLFSVPDACFLMDDILQIEKKTIND